MLLGLILESSNELFLFCFVLAHIKSKSHLHRLKKRRRLDSDAVATIEKVFLQTVRKSLKRKDP